MKIKKITSIYVLFFCCFCLSAFADDLAVTILEKGSGDPIEGATIVLGESGEYEATNNKGFAIFENIESVSELKILNPGYETLQKTIDKNTKKITLYIYPVTVEGESLEVVADRLQEKVSKITLVEAELRRVPGTAGDPLKVLNSLPGIVSGSGQGGPGALYVRGSGADENGVLINRIPVKYLFHFGDMSGIAPSTINPSLIKDFNAFLGGFPVEYEDKLGGMLDVKLRNPKKDRLHQTYRLAIHESAFLVEGPLNKERKTKDNTYSDSFYVAGRISYLDRVLTPTIVNKLIDSGADEDEKDDITIVTLPRYYDAQANWHRDLDKGYMDAYFFTAADSLAINLNHAEDTDPELLGDLSFNYDYQSVGFNWMHRHSNKINYMNTVSIRNFLEQQKIGADPNTGEPYFVDVQTVTSAYDPALSWKVKNDHEIIFGASLTFIKSFVDIYISGRPSEDNTNETFTTEKKYRLEDTINGLTAAPYIKHNWNITPKFKSSIGLRYSKVRASNNVDMKGFSPRVGLEYQLSENLLLISNWGKYLQRPEGSTLLAGFGNPGLKFTKAEHRIIGFEYQHSPLWKVKVEAYQKIMDKLVLVIPETAPPDNFENIGEGDATGIDLLIKREYANRKLGWLSYSYARSSRTTFNGNKRDFSGDQPHTLSMVWSQPLWGGWKRWSWGIKMSIHSGGLHTPIIDRNGMCFVGGNYEKCGNESDPESETNFSHWEPVKAKQNSERLPFYYQMSMRLDREIRFDTWKMNVFVDVQNLSFRKNVTGYNYGKKYEKINNRETAYAFYFPLPLFGIEAEF